MAQFVSDKINMVVYANSLDKYNYTITNLKVSLEDFEKAKEILSKYVELEPVDLLNGFIGKNSSIYVELSKGRKSYDLSIYTSTLELYSKLQAELKDIVKKENFREISLRNWFLENGEPSGADITIQKDDIIDVNEKYYPYLNVDLMLQEFFEGDENILILASEKGTAKSKMVSLIMKKFLEGKIKESGTFFVDTAKDISVISNDKFWSYVAEADLLVLDDLDFVLSSRNSDRNDVEKNKFLSNILSFSDGIKKNKTKILITTNQPIDEIDDAILRAGRLFGILSFRPLYREEALDVWKSEGLSEELFCDIFKNEDIIYPAELGSKISNIKRNKTLIKKKDWILDEDINGFNKIRKKAGFL